VVEDHEQDRQAAYSVQSGNVLESDFGFHDGSKCG
jgi:hypothetical protein